MVISLQFPPTAERVLTEGDLRPGAGGLHNVNNPEKPSHGVFFDDSVTIKVVPGTNKIITAFPDL